MVDRIGTQTECAECERLRTGTGLLGRERLRPQPVSVAKTERGCETIGNRPHRSLHGILNTLADPLASRTFSCRRGVRVASRGCAVFLIAQAERNTAVRCVKSDLPLASVFRLSPSWAGKGTTALSGRNISRDRRASRARAVRHSYRAVRHRPDVRNRTDRNITT